MQLTVCRPHTIILMACVKYLTLYSHAFVDDFSVMGGFNVTLAFGGNDERQSFQLTLLPDDIGEGPETIELQIVVPAGELGGVVPGTINRTTIVIVDDDCKTIHVLAILLYFPPLLLHEIIFVDDKCLVL